MNEQYYQPGMYNMYQPQMQPTYQPPMYNMYQPPMQPMYQPPMYYQQPVPVTEPVPAPVKVEPEKKEEDAVYGEKRVAVNFDFFKGDEKEDLTFPSPITPIEIKEKKTRKAKTRVIDGQNVLLARDVDDELPVCQSNEPYIHTYGETNSMLRGSIAQADELNMEIKDDIDSIRASKTLKNKYTYLTNLTASSSALIGTKIQAIKEIDNNITQSHNLDLKRIKDIKGAEADKQNDDMRIMDMYNAFINTPVGSYTQAGGTGPSMQELSLATASGFGNTDIISAAMVGHGNPLQTGPMTPEQQSMRLEGNSNIQAVVMYNQSTGQRWFEVVDGSTGAVVPNVSKPDNFLLEDTQINVREKIAHNRNIDATWPVVLIGEDVSEY